MRDSQCSAMICIRVSFHRHSIFQLDAMKVSMCKDADYMIEKTIPQRIDELNEVIVRATWRTSIRWSRANGIQDIDTLFYVVRAC